MIVPFLPQKASAPAAVGDIQPREASEKNTLRLVRCFGDPSLHAVGRSGRYAVLGNPPFTAHSFGALHSVRWPRAGRHTALQRAIRAEMPCRRFGRPLQQRTRLRSFSSAKHLGVAGFGAKSRPRSAPDSAPFQVRNASRMAKWDIKYDWDVRDIRDCRQPYVPSMRSARIWLIGRRKHRLAPYKKYL